MMKVPFCGNAAGGEGAWAAINPIGGEASRPFFSAVRDSGLVYIYSMFGDVVSLSASATGQ